MTSLPQLRDVIRANILADEAELIAALIERTGFDSSARASVSRHAAELVRTVRERSRPGLMESFMAEYGLGTDEGLALMSLAEALLRVPDTDTVDALIHDKVAQSEWSAHFGASDSPLVNFATRALSLAADVLGEPEVRPKSALHAATRRLGEPVIRSAVRRAMKMLGSQFVFARTIDEAIAEAVSDPATAGLYSFDMLGEAARTERDAARYMGAYANAIARLSTVARSASVRDNPGISVKLSALYPRYEFAKRDVVMRDLVERTRTLALAARAGGMGFNIDAEEADRLDLSLDIIDAVLATPELAGWDGFGVVVQAYGKRALPVIAWLDALATKHGRRIMVRLVKGAYWDAEIKRAQALGIDGFPVLTRKVATDVSYIAAARQLFAQPALYPQFATHNAHTGAAVLRLAKDAGRDPDTFEFQRLHGMGKTLHDVLAAENGTRTRIYAPVGSHEELLAYLVRRLLENGANASFVSQIADTEIPPESVAEDPIARALTLGSHVANPSIAAPRDLFAPDRINSAGVDLTDPIAVSALLSARERYGAATWNAVPIVAGKVQPEPPHPIVNPARSDDTVGTVAEATGADVATAIDAATGAFPAWTGRAADERADLLLRVADLYEAHRPELFALLAREAGKTLPDAVSEVREAVDFLRYYAAEGRRQTEGTARGPLACISPWNFPLAIFTGQIAAAIAAGNTVLAKPAPQTPIVAWRAMQLMHDAGIPNNVVQLLPGGASVGAALAADSRIAGIVFTGSLPTARRIDRAMAEALAPDAPLIAETGGINAMIVDTTALPEQAVRDILSSAFQSAGQRCSALRILYVQEEAAERTIAMLEGAMDTLTVGDPWELATDIGPIIDAAARARINRHIDAFAERGAVIKRLGAPKEGTFVGPAVLRVSGIADIAEEVFGPVLHVATFRSDAFDDVIADINRAGYGLTFGLHTRISSRIKGIADRIHVGNIYVNRNQIGAVVGSQPFGGEGLSGTGPKAGGPHYLPRLRQPAHSHEPDAMVTELPGPTGESNTLTLEARGTLLCLGPTDADRASQQEMARATGNGILDHHRVDGDLPANGYEAVAWFGDEAGARAIRHTLAGREGAIVPLITSPTERSRLFVERHVCVDTTAAGGNASLMAEAEADSET